MKPNFTDKSVIELVKMFNDDWRKDPPEWGEDTTASRNWEYALKKAIKTATELELLQALHEWAGEESNADYFDPRFWMLEQLRESIVGESLLTTIEQLETSLKVLLKQHSADNANITVEQLNRLKGGIT